MLATADFSNPLLWAVIIGWIFTVVLHEFAHGLVGYLGGDYTVRERGGLSLNPLQYIDPVNSIILPAVFLMMGGIPLPGGATFVRRDCLRSPQWGSAVSAAGPAMNFLIFLALTLPFHPHIGWIHVSDDPNEWTTGQMFMGALGFLQVIAMLINLLPVPPLDGFGIISPHLDPQTRQNLTMPPTSTILFLGLFFVLWQVPAFFSALIRITIQMMLKLGFDADAINFFLLSYKRCLFGHF